MNNEEEVSIYAGSEVWKSMIEYHNKWTFIRGYPYYKITRVDEVYYLWELLLDDPDHVSYRIMKKSNDFSPLWDEGMKLADEIGKKYAEMELYRLEGKDLVDKLKSKENKENIESLESKE
ncbi:MAG: hypothetical protein MUF15_20575 [Acidobacteria bacterium]|jgi:hypothetical protein|nr:hypothetical protein [Acidobacteriota bacterium]